MNYQLLEILSIDKFEIFKIYDKIIIIIKLDYCRNLCNILIEKDV
jgi:hypothetical protein